MGFGVGFAAGGRDLAGFDLAVFDLAGSDLAEFFLAGFAFTVNVGGTGLLEALLSAPLFTFLFFRGIFEFVLITR